MIDPERVEEIVLDSLYMDEELPEGEPSREKMPEGTVYGEGIITTFAFHGERLESHRAEVREMLDQLPREVPSCE